MDKRIVWLHKTFVNLMQRSLAILPHALGINTPHSPEFRFERPRGEAGYALLMCFRTPAMVLTETGLVRARPGDCFVHSPGTHLLHYSVEGAATGFRNDWLYVRGDVARRCMKTVELPWNTALETGRPDAMEGGIQNLMRELSGWDTFSDAAASAIVLMLLVAVARGWRAEGDRDLRNKGGRVHYNEFREIRAGALADFRHPWTVEELARKASLSPERFSVLYRSFFGASPISEIIDARMLCAQRLLCYSGLSVKEVARECGFEDIYYFSRLFRRKNGVSPAQWRKRDQLS